MQGAEGEAVDGEETKREGNRAAQKSSPTSD